MNLHQLFLTGNECYEAGVHFEPKGLCWHSTGAINTQLRRYVNPDDGELGQNQYNNHWNQHMAPELKCVHGFIGTLKTERLQRIKLFLGICAVGMLAKAKWHI